MAQGMARSAVRTMGSAVGRENGRGVLGSIFDGKKRCLEPSNRRKHRYRHVQQHIKWQY